MAEVVFVQFILLTFDKHFGSLWNVLNILGANQLDVVVPHEWSPESPGCPGETS